MQRDDSNMNDSMKSLATTMHMSDASAILSSSSSTPLQLLSYSSPPLPLAAVGSFIAATEMPIRIEEQLAALSLENVAIHAINKPTSTAAAVATPLQSTSATAASPSITQSGASAATATAVKTNEAEVETSAPLSNIDSRSKMIRALERDSGSTFQLCKFLTLKDLVHLNSTCCSWRRWLDTDGAIDKRSYDWNLSKVSQLSFGSWLHRHITGLDVQSGWNLNKGKGGQLMSDMLRQVSSFPLTNLHLRLQVKTLPDDALCASFAGLTKLQELHVICSGYRSEAIMKSVFKHVSLLCNLRVLGIEGETGDPGWMNLSALTHLPHLEKFELSCSRTFRCTAEQVRCLAQCKQLTWLNCGSWSSMKGELDEEGKPMPSEVQQLDDGIGAFVRSRFAASSSPATAATSPSVIDCTPCAELTYLDLNATKMTPFVWSFLTPLTSLVELCPAKWSDGMNPKQWHQLTQFKQLKSIIIEPDEIDDKDRSLMQVHDFLPSLLQCRTITKLTLGRGLQVSSEDVRQIATDLIQLTELTLNGALVESLASLTLVPQLVTLNLNRCSSLTGDSPQFLTALPSLPHLTQLKIQDRFNYRQNATETKALLARMPKLQASGFTYGGLRDDFDDDDPRAYDDDDEYGYRDYSDDDYSYNYHNDYDDDYDDDYDNFRRLREDW